MSDYRLKIKKGRGKSTDGFVFRDEQFEKEYPTLFDFLSSVSDSSGRAQEPGSIKIFVSEGKLKVLVKSPQEAAVAFETPDQLTGLWEVLDHKLNEGALDWRDDKFGSNGKS